VSRLLDPGDFLNALCGRKYVKMVNDANDYAYEQSGVWAVPSYRMDGKKLDAVEGVGVTRAQLEEFIKKVI